MNIEVAEMEISIKEQKRNLCLKTEGLLMKALGYSKAKNPLE